MVRIAETTPEDPLGLFAAWFKEAEGAEPNDHNAVALATVGEDGMPSLRMVLLKGYDAEGFVFYTNLESRKGVQLQSHPKAALLFHWKSLRRQIRIEGPVSAVSEAEADAYFASRPRQSQIGAWASDQSRLLEGRFELEKRVARFAAKYAIGQVPRPRHWSGFRILAQRIEFWQDGAFRLHDRLVYHREEGGEAEAEAGGEAGRVAWRTERLFP